MKTKNFPGKKDQRRRRALAKLLAKPKKTARELVEIKTLQEAISDNARSARTKKTGGRAERLAKK